MGLAYAVEKAIFQEHLIEQGDTVVVAVSGGSDSVALLHILNQMKKQHGWQLVVAHVNHNFRKEESAQEAVYVQELAASLELPCEVGVIDVPAYIEQTSLNSQVAAREKRYEFLHQVANKYEANRIALAHHADDQAETVLMRLLRGTGPSGLAGILPSRLEKNVQLIRPLLRINKEALIAYCEEMHITYYEDSSNKLRKYFRNEIRLDVMPYLQQFNEHFPDALVRLADMMRAEDEHMEHETIHAAKELVTLKDGEYSIARSLFIQRSIALQRRVIKLILNYLVSSDKLLDFIRIDHIRKMIVRDSPTTQRISLDRDVHVIREYDQVIFVKKILETESFYYLIDQPKMQADISVISSVVALQVLDVHEDQFKEGMPIDSSGRTDCQEAWFDLNEVHFPLIVRSRMNGDRIEPYGLNGSKKVKNMLIDAKVPPRQRERIPLIVDQGDRVLWIPGLRRSRHALVDANKTKRILHIKLESEE
ncbi:tRNA lysidine(34) synthetase TilS [Paenibacillus albiflavus]|uniref:tRNA(Ile)-lysidine synthase n=1 Tax=Paenibacillus albiflavus TaxID=2545760 RepID=A0A4R4E430_9BACL|nr:tRNA lysidine(34) synthetase TilS [Paenibacillus albiflavus]TCZ74334.1 tRNA lysidine(34) synthetase TilS [Paenibacillus albiflavus]